MTYEQFAEKLMELRLKQSVVCREAGVHPSTIWRWKLGRTDSRYTKTIEKLEEALVRLKPME